VRQFLLAFVFSIAVGVITLSGSVAAPARGEVAVVFRPFTSEAEAWNIIRAAGGYLVAPTRLPNVVVAFAPDEGFQARAQSLGAFLFLNATGLCAPLKETTT
jgi:hypothetical protein